MNHGVGSAIAANDWWRGNHYIYQAGPNSPMPLAAINELAQSASITNAPNQLQLYHPHPASSASFIRNFTNPGFLTQAAANASQISRSTTENRLQQAAPGPALTTHSLAHAPATNQSLAPAPASASSVVPPRITVLSLEEALGQPESEKDVNRALMQSIRLSESDKSRIGRVMDELYTCLTRHSESVDVANLYNCITVQLLKIFQGKFIPDLLKLI